MTIKAVSYLRTSTDTNTGEGKDSGKRQGIACTMWALKTGATIVKEFYDEDVRGSIMVTERPGFREMLNYCLDNQIHTIVVETANRFSRDLMVQEIGFKLLQDRGITLVAADKPDMFLDQSPTSVAVRQMLGVMAQLEKDMTVARLKGARDRKSAELGKECSGRKSFKDTNPQAYVEIKKLARYPVNNRKRSLREIADAAAAKGILSSAGKPITAMQIKRILEA